MAHDGEADPDAAAARLAERFQAEAEDRHIRGMAAGAAVWVDALGRDAGGEPGQRSLTDAGNGRRIVDYEGTNLRYTPGLGWALWDTDESYWVQETADERVHEKTKALPNWIAGEAVRETDDSRQSALLKWSHRCNNIGMRKAAMADAATDPRVLVPATAWDSQHSLLGVSNGVVNLRDGSLIPKEDSRDYLISKRSNLEYVRGRNDPVFDSFLDFATGGDRELADYLQLAAGYTLTGERDQECFFIVHGPPSSGKSMFLDMLSLCLGTYSTTMTQDDLSGGFAGASGGGGSIEYYMAGLAGRRMLAVSELKENGTISEDTVKRMTGDALVTGRHPRGKPFTFEPRAKLWIGTNHKPPIRDTAMWRRVRAIPFDFVPENPDQRVKLWLHDPSGGLPAFLAWAVEGAARFYDLRATEMRPLRVEASRRVLESTAEYRQAEDRLAIFVEDDLEACAGGSASMRDVFTLYQTWAEDRGERPVSFARLLKMFAEAGFAVSGRSRRDAALHEYRIRPRTAPGGGAGYEFNWAVAADGLSAN